MGNYVAHKMQRATAVKDRISGMWTVEIDGNAVTDNTFGSKSHADKFIKKTVNRMIDAGMSWRDIGSAIHKMGSKAESTMSVAEEMGELAERVKSRAEKQRARKNKGRKKRIDKATAKADAKPAKETDDAKKKKGAKGASDRMSKGREGMKMVFGKWVKTDESSELATEMFALLDEGLEESRLGMSHSDPEWKKTWARYKRDGDYPEPGAVANRRDKLRKYAEKVALAIDDISAGSEGAYMNSGRGQWKTYGSKVTSALDEIESALNRIVGEMKML